MKKGRNLARNSRQIWWIYRINLILTGSARKRNAPATASFPTPGWIATPPQITHFCRYNAHVQSEQCSSSNMNNLFMQQKCLHHNVAKRSEEDLGSTLVVYACQCQCELSSKCEWLLCNNPMNIYSVVTTAHNLRTTNPKTFLLNSYVHTIFACI